MGEGDSAVGVSRFTREKDSERSAHDLAPANDHGVFPLGGNFAEAENFENSCRGTWKKTGGISKEKLSEVYWVKTVDIFGGRDAGIDLIVGKCWGKGRLDEDSVNFWIGIEGVDFGQESREGGPFRKHQGMTRNADFLGPRLFSRNIGA